MISPKEQKARDLEALEEVRLRQMMEALEDPNVPEAMKHTIRKRLKVYHGHLQDEIDKCSGKAPNGRKE